MPAMLAIDMVNRTTTMVLLAVLACAATAAAQAQTIQIRATGEHRAVIGDTPELAAGLVLADARRKAVHAAVAQLEDASDVKVLGLKRVQLEAFTAVLVRAGERPASTAVVSGEPFRVQLESAVNGSQAVRHMTDLKKDQDTAYELVEAWTGTERLISQLSDLTRRRAGAATDAAAQMAQEQQALIKSIEIKALIAQAYHALTRTEPVTVGGRVSSAAGRERAAKLAQAALALSPDSSDAHVLLGDLLVETEQPVEAEAAYRKGLQGNPQSSSLHTKLAAALRLQGNFPEALEELRQALTIDPAFARAHSDLGMILKAEQKLPAAIAAYREAVRLDPDSSDAHNGLAVALANSGRLEEAVVHFREIVRIDPDSTIGYYNLAYVLADLDRDVESAAALREVVRINPNHYNARYNLGELFRLEQKFDDSAAQFREYLRLAPDTPQNRRNITRAKRLIQQFEDPHAPPMPSGPMAR